MNWGKLLETVMLICFGAAWPFSITKSWRARTAKGKSIGFLLVILTGYVAGIAKVCITDGFYTGVVGVVKHIKKNLCVVVAIEGVAAAAIMHVQRQHLKYVES